MRYLSFFLITFLSLHSYGVFEKHTSIQVDKNIFLEFQAGKSLALSQMFNKKSSGDFNRLPFKSIESNGYFFSVSVIDKKMYFKPVYYLRYSRHMSPLSQIIGDIDTDEKEVLRQIFSLGAGTFINLFYFKRMTLDTLVGLSYAYELIHDKKWMEPSYIQADLQLSLKVDLGRGFNLTGQAGFSKGFLFLDKSNFSFGDHERKISWNNHNYFLTAGFMYSLSQ